MERDTSCGRSTVAYIITEQIASCTWQRRDAEVFKTFAFFVNNFHTVNVVYKEVLS